MIKYKKEELYKTQRSTFEKIIKRHASHLYSEWRDLFAEFWIEFLAGKVVSIADFLFKDRRDPKKELKRGFVDGR